MKKIKNSFHRLCPVLLSGRKIFNVRLLGRKDSKKGELANNPGPGTYNSPERVRNMLLLA
jgi:hypothetical protein